MLHPIPIPVSLVLVWPVITVVSVVARARSLLAAVKVKGLCPLTLRPECVCIPPVNGTRALSNCGNSTEDQDDKRKEKGKCLIKTNCFLFCSKRGKRNYRLIFLFMVAFILVLYYPFSQ